jgi:hypothetical protein
MGLGFPLVTDVRDPADQPAGVGGLRRARVPDLPPGEPGPPSRDPQPPVREPQFPPREAQYPLREAQPPAYDPQDQSYQPQAASYEPPAQPYEPQAPSYEPQAPREPGFPARARADQPPRGYAEQPSRGPDRGGEAFPVRQPAFRPPRAGGRHRRAVPASLPQTAPALVIAVPGAGTDLGAGPAAELTQVLRVDNPAVEVRAARIDGGGAGDPSDLRVVLTEAASSRPGNVPCAVVIPLIATVNPPVIHRLRAAVAESGTNATISGFVNSNAMVAEALHIRLAEAGLARADRVRLFSIVTAADGVLIATVGGPDAAGAANVTSVLLAARLALPVITASADSEPSVADGVQRLRQMGVTRLAIAPCFIGPEATRADLESLRIPGTEVAAPIGAQSNIAKLAALTYGHAISQLDLPAQTGPVTRGAHE